MATERQFDHWNYRVLKRTSAGEDEDYQMIECYYDRYGRITAPDAAVLILATVLHDLGMHLTSDGFWSLVQGQSWHQPLPEFGDRPWPAA